MRARVQTIFQEIWAARPGLEPFHSLNGVIEVRCDDAGAMVKGGS